MSTTTEHHAPSLHLPEFDDDDAFDTADDEGAAYVFSPDAIREEMARNMPDDEPEPEPAPLSTHTNTSVSTLDIDAPPLSAMSDSLDSSFSQISLDTPARTHPDLPPLELEHSIYPSPPASTVADEYHETNGLENNGHAYTGNSRSPTPPTSTLPSLPPPPHSAPAETSSSSRLSPPNSASASQTGFTSTTPRSSQDGGNVLLTEKTFPSRRARRSLGPSAFEKVVSKTRPTFLPPKPREEDMKHLADWQLMMAQSRQLAEKRRKALTERRLAREKTIEDTVHVWERDIMPDWRVVYRNAALRRLWWNGIPTKLRAQLWEKAVGNALALSKDHYRTCLSRAKRALSSGVFPQATMDLMEQDIATTLPSVHLFLKESGPMYEDLKEILCAWVVSRSDEGLGYTLGAAKIAAMLLISMPGPRAFIVMRNLLERHCLRSFFGGERARDDVEAYYRIFDTLLADGMPKIYFNFKQHQIAPGAYLPDWLIPLFLNHLPFEACARIWDVILLEGDSFLYRAALGILAVLEPRLFFPDRRELLELLRGENKAALDAAKREGLSLNGGKYEIYGVDEETLWERIDSMNDWWKDSTWTRLIQRELPDI
ncbi:hypothetical protein HYPSUDRAFT_82866 [Hypholoma sublateritium FD-334 SS-4]|uniref:Rab-GAP TBC domain-containing protein n=1 Tax=Hypholoma sublateritium (strain FD-334 SS-4) TaxID=945553 RepID=A0A0D2PCC2_HYPSF|nr:hypothetical protein HYPSUDRAFT_82866 [Hypholoma sublateritium FD-334 SS-4]